MMQTFQQWLRTRMGLASLGVIELILTYVFASIAIDRGNPLYYLVAFILLVNCVQNIVKLSLSLFETGL